MKHSIIQVGTFDVNCSIISRNGNVWVVDPGSEGDRIVSCLKDENLFPTAILLTHAHFDHIGGIPELQTAFPELPVYAHPNDKVMFAHPMNQYMPDYPSIGIPKNLRDARELADVTVIETPGHTPGGVCYYFAAEKLLLSGDTLFAGSVGRTDLPGGDMARLMQSLKSLMQLPEDTKVIPGHGPETTIALEKKGNPFVRA